MHSVFVAIVNFRTATLACECLASLEGMVPSLAGGRVIVVDNDSGDGSAHVIADFIVKKQWSAWAEVLPMPRNGGFAYGNNAAIKHALGIDAGLEWVLLLNPDTVVRAGAIDLLLDQGRRDVRVGLIGAGIENQRGMREASAHRFPTPLGELEGSAGLSFLSRLLRRYAVTPVQPVDSELCEWVSGACMAIRREVLESVGLLDEGYFLYFEEVDFCLRAHRAGWSCLYVPGARVMHIEGAATGIHTARRRRPAYWYDSRRRFFSKAYGIGGLVLADVLWALGRLSLVTRRLLRLGGRAGQQAEPRHLTRDMLLGDARAVLSGNLFGVRRTEEQRL